MALLSRLLDTFRSSKVEQRIDEEVSLHLEFRVQELIKTGMSEKDARAQVLRRFGSPTLARERSRDVDVVAWLDGLRRDLRNGARSLWRSKGYSVTALLILMLAIGVNTTNFSIFYSSLISPFSFDPKQLVVIESRNAKGEVNAPSCPDMEDLRRDSTNFANVTYWLSQTANLTGEGEPDRVRASYSNSTFFRTFGVTPIRGRDFTPDEDVPGAPRTVLMSYGLWQSRYAGSESALGSKIVLNNEPYTVAGILPPGFVMPFDREVGVWLTMAGRPDYPNFVNSRMATCGFTFGRLKAGVSLEQARAEVATISGRLAQQYPASNKDKRLNLTDLRQFYGANIRAALYILTAAVGFVLLIACTNLAGLALSRAIAKERELSVRAALGAGRGHLLRHLFSEMALLCAAGCALGVGVGYGLNKVLIATEQIGPESALHWPVVLFSAGVSLCAAILVTAVPAYHVLHGRTLALRDGDRAASSGPNRNTFRRVAMTLQVAMSLILLVGAGLMIRSLQHVAGIDPGFRPENLLTLEYRMPPNKYPKPEQQEEFHRTVVERVRALPGVESASVPMAIPFSGNVGGVAFVLLDRQEPEKGKEPRAEWVRVDPNYFATMKIPIRSGRGIERSDVAGAPRIAVINESLARRWWPHESPIGRSLKFVGGPGVPITIVGVVGNVRQTYPLEAPQADQIYTSFMQLPNIFGTLVVRTMGDPLAMTSAVRGAVWSVDKDQPVWKIRTQESLLDRASRNRRFLASLLAGFSLFALLLTSVGIYGVIRYWVEQRTREIGVRVAMGAQPGDILKLVTGQGIRMTIAGLIVGIPAALGLATLIKSQLFGIQPSDPPTLGTVALILTLVAIAASLLPALRASRRDPLEALRADG